MKLAGSLFLVVVLIAIDQATKFAVELNLPFQERVDFLPFISLFRTYNDGVAFSFMSGWNSNVLTLMIITIILFVSWMWIKMDSSRKYAHFGFAFILGGAIGNLIDRILVGHVIDFIMFHTQNWSFAIFNPADAFISIGAALIILDEVINIRQNRQANTKGNS